MFNLLTSTILEPTTSNTPYFTMLFEIPVNIPDYNNLEDEEIHLNDEVFQDKIQIITHDNNSEIECSICNDIINKDEQYAKTKCDHIYHEECIKIWLLDKCRIPTCPVCRKDIRNM